MLPEYDPRSPAVQQCPFPWYAQMRRQTPVFREPHTGWWFVTRYADVEGSFRRHDVLSSRVGAYLRPAPLDAELAEQVAAIRADGWPEVPVLVVEDPPTHRRQRALVQRAFSPRRVQSMEQAVRRILGELLDDVQPGVPFDFVSTVAAPFPLRVIADALQIPSDRIADFKRWSDNRVKPVGGNLTPADHLEIAASEVERQQYFAAAFDDRRASPRDDLMTDLVTAQQSDEEDRSLSTGELLSIIGQVLAAGNESTTKAVTDMVFQLAASPAAWEWLREDPAGRAQRVADESLRLACPFQILLRVAKEDVEIGGVPIPADSVVALVAASGSMDDDVFMNATRMEPWRENAADHLAFGSGIHRCVGATLARMELTVAAELLATRYERLQVVDPMSVTFEASFIIRGMKALPTVAVLP